MICRKLYLKPGMHLLDIGCGWGAFGKYAAEKYNCEVVGITVSKNQVELGRKLCDDLPVEFLLTDYDKTLMAWYYNFEKNWDEIKKNIRSAFSGCGNTSCSQPPAHSDQEYVISYGRLSCPKMGYPEAINQSGNELKKLRATFAL